jgi:hypothetical protein
LSRQAPFAVHKGMQENRPVKVRREIVLTMRPLDAIVVVTGNRQRVAAVTGAKPAPRKRGNCVRWKESTMTVYTVYTHSNMPTIYIVERSGEWWLVDACANGWQNRRPYVGDRTRLDRAILQTHLGVGLPE